MDKEKVKHSSDKITESTLHELLSSINARLGHLEDIEADNRAIIIKLVKQGNDIVSFLRNLEIDEITDEFEESIPDITSPTYNTKFTHIKELVEEFMDKAADLKELEKELKKHKDQITPGQVGES
tara:strand:- start:233 stop:607 length:375 start_codon:yes stop_codon:yes gene_type:complete